MNIEEFIPIKKEESEINQMSPLVWAYVGDCVYELYIRTYLVDNTSLKPHKLHIESIKYVKAGAQAKFLENFYDDLTDDEKDIVRRGRNANSYTHPKNMDISDYRHATGLEAVFGYLYLSGQQERITELFELAYPLDTEEN